MKIRRAFQTIDSHTVGEPTRTIVGGIPVIPGSTMSEKMLYLRDEADWIRQVLMYEPRGNEVMSGAVLTTPCTPGADIGVIYIEVGGYLPMCGHDTIGVSTALVEAGMVPVSEPYTHINLDTPAGLVKVKVLVSDGVAKEVSFTNVPSFVMKKDVTVDVPEYGKITLDISYGGNVYAILPAERVGLTVAPENSRKLIAAAAPVKKAVNEQVKICHPEKSYINEVTHVEFYGPPSVKGASVKNAVVIPPGAIDRSPCGTGTAAKMALMHARGQLAIGEEFVHESIIGSIFKCRILEETTESGIPAIVPEVTGSAYITGMHTFFIDPDDPFPRGFQLQ